MKREVLRTISCLFIIMALMALSGCRDIFHSKENIDYTSLVLDKEYSNSVKKGSRYYYKFHAEQDVTYYISWDTSSRYSLLPSYDKDRIKVATFWYDTGGTISGEKEGYKEVISFPSSRTGDVVVRITTDKEYGTADFKFMVSTTNDNVAGGKY
jgi:hypothetical protein